MHIVRSINWFENEVSFGRGGKLESLPQWKFIITTVATIIESLFLIKKKKKMKIYYLPSEIRGGYVWNCSASKQYYNWRGISEKVVRASKLIKTTIRAKSAQEKKTQKKFHLTWTAHRDIALNNALIWRDRKFKLQCRAV